MDKKMTSGEIAKKAGISQKAVRLYDEKGLLKPAEYSEGNYRLYDKEALLILEKIIALKHIGFSLEEIHDNLIAEKNLDIKESLYRQLEIMEQKKAEIERVIGCIRGMLVRCDDEPDWNTVADIAQMIQKDQGADERHFYAMKHTAEKKDWYERIYESLGIKTDSKILDLGCGFGKLWRNNWQTIPENVIVDGYDLHGSWADNLAEFITEHRSELAQGTDIGIHWADVEAEATWQQISNKYDYVIAHYLLGFLEDSELLIQRAASVLAEDGMFSCNGAEVSREGDFWKVALENMGLKTDFVTTKNAEAQKQYDAFKSVLEKYFSRIEIITLPNNLRYEDAGELFERMCERYPEGKKYLQENENRIKKYFEDIIAREGELFVAMNSQFWHCYK